MQFTRDSVSNIFYRRYLSILHLAKVLCYPRVEFFASHLAKSLRSKNIL